MSQSDSILNSDESEFRQHAEKQTMKRPLGRLVRFGLIATALVLFAIPPTWAMWKMPTQMPISRLLKNVRDYVKAHPHDAHGY
jgi:hypothetical protein